MIKKKLNEILTITCIDAKGSVSLSLRKWILFLVLVLILISFLFNIYYSNNICKTTKTIIKYKEQIINKPVVDNRILDELTKYKNITKDNNQIIKRLNHNNMNLKKQLSKKIIPKKMISKNLIDYLFQVIPNGSPLSKFEITGNFGFRTNLKTGVKKYFNSIELKASIGTEIYATADGVVRYARDVDKKSFGKVIIIAHSYGFETVYAHMDSLNVKLGDIITKGQIIGKTGKTGSSEKANLYYEVRYATNITNPLDFIKLNKQNYNDILNDNILIKWESIKDLAKKQIEQRIK
jgi:murein DD-endopeptidase MepM/ murein hydrolase activator NlpD